MKIAVIGAGIIGITTAYELASDGHEVTVFERHATAAEEGSFANAGVIAPGLVTPWMAQGMPTKVLRHLLLNRHSPFTVSLPLARSDIAWMRQWLRTRSLEVFQANRARMHRLAFYSRQRLHELSSELRLEYDQSQGYLVLLRDVKDARRIEPHLAVLREAGVSFEKLSVDTARAVEPGLNAGTSFLGAVHLPDDQVANCRQFALLLKDQAQQKGVIFAFNTAVERIEPARAASISIAKVWLEGAPQPLVFDQVVLCAGMASKALAKPLGLAIPLAAVYGYSISLPLREVLDAPRSGLLDERYQVTITRMGNRVRIAGGLQIGGHADTMHASSLQTLYKVLQDWFPGCMPQGAARLGGLVQTWKGVRPMLPDGPPVIGASGVPGIWLNTGHGANGWTLGCGSARLLADLVAGRTPDIDIEGLDIGRFR